MMPNPDDRCYPYGVRWHQREGWLLWLDRPDPNREVLWTDSRNYVPIFETYQQLASFALSLNVQLKRQDAQPTNLDAAAAWLAGGTEPPAGECLRVWNLFDDLSASVQKAFGGNERHPARNRVFDLLYAESGPYRNATTPMPWQLNEPVQWQPGERNTLRCILTQGFEMWRQSTYWQRAT